MRELVEAIEDTEKRRLASRDMIHAFENLVLTLLRNIDITDPKSREILKSLRSFKDRVFEFIDSHNANIEAVRAIAAGANSDGTPND